MIETEQRYVYPDAAIICGEPEYDEVIPTAARNPVIVVEVHSPGSRRYDLGENFKYDSSLPSLREYIAVYQDSYRVVVHQRSNYTDAWDTKVRGRLSANVDLPSLAESLPMQEIYRKVRLGNE